MNQVLEIPGFVDVSDVLRGGVYVLVFKGKVMYIGQSKSMVVRIYTHRSKWRRGPQSDIPKWLPVKGIQYDEVHVRVCAVSDIDRIEQEMIRLYKPPFNTYHVHPTDVVQPPELILRGKSFALAQTFVRPRPQIERRI